MIVIDGSLGEGGGQILRTSIALSAITQTPVKIINIRRNRPKPGLAAQHVTGIKAVSNLCSAHTKGLNIGSIEIEFTPHNLIGGSHKLDIGTAGSITLVLQACLPAALCSPHSTLLELTGGTDVKFAPPIDYFRYIIAPLLEKMGAGFDFLEIRRGYYPKGGGYLKLKINPPSKTLKPLLLTAPGQFKQASGIINIANLPDHISRRMEGTAQEEFKKNFKDTSLDLRYDNKPGSLSSGVGLTLWANFENAVIGASALGERGIPAEKLAKSAVQNLFTEIQAGAAVDVYAADQLLIYLAIGKGNILARQPLSNHAVTNISVIEQFYGDIFKKTIKDKLVNIEII
jgi:RNA 3'-phosphate cyclase